MTKLETPGNLGSRFAEATLWAEAAAFAIQALQNAAHDDQISTKLKAIGQLVNQTSELLDELRTEMRQMFGPDDAGAAIARIVEALGFYADHTHYDAPRKNALPEVMKDRGEKARDLLDSITGGE